MAEGARDRFAATVAASVTGIAGPDGGSEAKPVGLTYVAVADADGVEVRRHRLVRRPGREQGRRARPRSSSCCSSGSAPRASAGSRG